MKSNGKPTSTRVAASSRASASAGSTSSSGDHAEIQDLSGAHRVVERTYRLFDVRCAIPHAPLPRPARRTSSQVARSIEASAPALCGKPELRAIARIARRCADLRRSTH